MGLSANGVHLVDGLLHWGRSQRQIMLRSLPIKRFQGCNISLMYEAFKVWGQWAWEKGTEERLENIHNNTLYLYTNLWSAEFVIGSRIE